MKKIELSELKYYLDSELKFIMTTDYLDEFGHFDEWSGVESDYKEGSIWTYAGEVDSGLNISCGDGDISRVFKKGNTWISIDCKGIKPLVYPLSMLTEEITVDGETFVPIIELLNIHSGMNWTLNHYEVGVGNSEVWVNQKQNKTVAFGFNFKNGFYSINNSRSIVIVENQFILWSKLFDWHFDVFNWLDQGLAIDKSKV